ncbi:hypothetical protein DBV05_g11249 [Lasiodiplodia theobromae]|uniref:Prion-inhibition and propagation HeLo domain-containing protein n=1 Tax=Lasiodiplodia theobromae TaxID=45133 RepID=A0A5N5CXJ5_9PEZI|nr:hypothetical protein DBV05_g11249 [Lasiodiplodia theobromae]
MAKVALQLLDLLSTVMAQFNSIQLVQLFDQDFSVLQTKLYIIQVRLLLWSILAGLLTWDGKVAVLAIRDSGVATNLFREVLGLCELMRGEASKLKPNEITSIPIAPGRDISLPRQRLLSNLQAYVELYQAQLGIMPPSKLTFYKKDQFDEFVARVSQLIDHLENLLLQKSSMPAHLKELGTAESGVTSKKFLGELDRIVKGGETCLHAAVKAMMRQLPTDSGYESSAGLVSEEKKADDDTCSMHSILTNAPRIQLGMEGEEDLVSAFAVDLCQDMQINGRMGVELRLMLPRLHSLLKGFALRLQENARSMDERNAAELVRQQRE